MPQNHHDPGPEILQRHDLSQRYPYRPSEYAVRFAWELAQTLVFRTSPRRAYRWRAWWLRRFGARLGRPCGLRHSAQVLHPWLLTIGRYSSIGDGVNIYNLGPVSIGDHTTISQDAYLCAGTHDYTKPDMPLLRTGINIGSGVWICAGAFIGPGVTVGDNAVVGARAVVTKDVPPGMVVAGNPARVIKPRLPAAQNP